MSQANPSEYNNIFERLVLKHPEDSIERIAGMLAYSEYKLDKQAWFVRMEDILDSNTMPQKRELKGELDAFLAHYDERTLNKYVADPENLLYTFAASYAEAEIKERLSEITQNATLKELSNSEDRLSKQINQSYWKPVQQSIVASIIFSFILFMFALTIRFASPDSNFGQLLQYIISPAQYSLKVEKIEKKQIN